MNEEKIKAVETAEDNDVVKATTLSTTNVTSTPEIGSLALALSKAQGEFDIASKDSDNSFHKSKYASIDDVLMAIRPYLSKNGLAILQFPSGNINEICITTRLIHSSGQWIESEISAPPVVNVDKVSKQLKMATIQDQGKTITYLRRYSIVSILAIAQEDDDGNSALPKPKDVCLSYAQQDTIEDMLKGYPRVRNRMIEDYKKISSIKAEQYNTVIERIQKNIDYIEAQKMKIVELEQKRKI